MIRCEKQYLKEPTSALFALKDGPIYDSVTNNKIELVYTGEEYEIIETNEFGWVHKGYNIRLTPMSYYTFSSEVV